MSSIRQAIVDTILADITDLERAKSIAAKYIATLEYEDLAQCLQDAHLPLPADAETRYRTENIVCGLQLDFEEVDYVEYDKSIGRVVRNRDCTIDEQRTIPLLYDLLRQSKTAASVVTDTPSD
jgi:hypothetical protein